MYINPSSKTCNRNKLHGVAPVDLIVQNREDQVQRHLAVGLGQHPYLTFSACACSYTSVTEIVNSCQWHSSQIYFKNAKHHNIFGRALY